MRVKQGWSGEIAPNTWAKADVVLDETDLLRLVGTHAPDLPATDFPLIPVHLVYQLLEAEAEALLTAKLATRYGLKDSATKLSRMSASKQKTLEAIRAWSATR